MNLSVKERLILLNILPSQDSYENILILQELKNELGLSEQDHKDMELVNLDGDMSWNPDKEVPSKEVSIGLVAFGLIKKALIKLDSDGLISMDFTPIYKRFVLDEAVVNTEVTDIDNARTG